eukprot:TRINITY_DN15237_c0_g1_i13.p1 TRINITY_DN15237_c0_g1~~TRINITY_DN15237_c0_g1_i13.p1  ORF type:complete len:209 (+),score=-7.04 TRINITY_DN15237_c0_g1_i13:839-1465(+)
MYTIILEDIPKIQNFHKVKNQKFVLRKQFQSYLLKLTPKLYIVKLCTVYIYNYFRKYPKNTKCTKNSCEKLKICSQKVILVLLTNPKLTSRDRQIWEIQIAITPDIPQNIKQYLYYKNITIIIDKFFIQAQPETKLKKSVRQHKKSKQYLYYKIIIIEKFFICAKPELVFILQNNENTVLKKTASRRYIKIHCTKQKINHTTQCLLVG